MCKESRADALKTYQLRFACSPEFARVYFSYEHDTLLLTSCSLGADPGRLARKMSDEECSNVWYLMIGERLLLLHAKDSMHELERFTGLESICVFCDEDHVESGDEYGAEEMDEMDEVLDERLADEDYDLPMTESWPELYCLRNDEDRLPPCSGHWWFYLWSHRTMSKQKEKGPKILAASLRMTLAEGGEDNFLERLYTFTNS
jgi:hypothetical protein